MAAYSNEPERPRIEPEILPPDRSDRAAGRDGWPPHPHGAGYGSGSQRIFVTRIGPFGFALAMLVVGLFAAVLLLLLIGTALIWLPFVAAILIVGAVAGLLRRL
ncbi:MAG: hypothetical protein WBE48_26305 [Xanthobacteraceae bacterium]